MHYRSQKQFWNMAAGEPKNLYFIPWELYTLGAHTQADIWLIFDYVATEPCKRPINTVSKYTR